MRNAAKRAVSLLLACLLLGLGSPMAFAADPPVDVSGAAPLALGVVTMVNYGDVFSYTPDETGWVRFETTSNALSLLTVLDHEKNLLQGWFSSAGVTTVKALAGKPLYFVTGYNGNNPDWSGTITLTPGQPPVLKQDTLKLTVSGSVLHYNPFQEAYIGFTFTVNGEAPPAYGFFYSGDVSMSRTDIAVGTYALRFTSYDGEDLGSLTVKMEKITLRGWLADLLAGIIGFFKSLFQ